MTERAPTEITNLDRYGSAALPWSRPHDLLTAAARTFVHPRDMPARWSSAAVARNVLRTETNRIVR